MKVDKSKEENMLSPKTRLVRMVGYIVETFGVAFTTEIDVFAYILYERKLISKDELDKILHILKT